MSGEEQAHASLSTGWEPDVPVGDTLVLTRPQESGAWPVLLDAARGFFPPDRWWVVLSLWPTPDLADLGLVRVGHPPLMLRPPAAAPPPPPGLEIRAVTGASDLADFERVLVAGFGLEGVGTPVIADLALAGDVLHLLVGYADGEPVACAGGAVHHGIVEVDWVATLPSRRPDRVAPHGGFCHTIATRKGCPSASAR